MVFELGLEPVSLSYRESKGQTIIEKLERISRECCFAIVLLTPDDEGKSKSEKRLNARARQNVVLELGYFYALLGREKVLVAYKDGVEKPSDIHGIIYYKFNKDVSEIRSDLIEELSACKIEFKI